MCGVGTPIGGLSAVFHVKHSVKHAAHLGQRPSVDKSRISTGFTCVNHRRLLWTRAGRLEATGAPVVRGRTAPEDEVKWSQ